MKKWLGLAILCAGVGAVLWLVFGSRRSTDTPIPQASSETIPSRSATNPSSVLAAGKTISSVPAPAADVNKTPATLPANSARAASLSPTAHPVLISHELEFTNVPPETVMENMRASFRSYAAKFGGNPVGTNPEITEALNGGNPKQTHFLDEENGLRINAKGELIDPWGTPFFFHQLAREEMEIHSAGPDKVMWTDDDLVIK